MTVPHMPVAAKTSGQPAVLHLNLNSSSDLIGYNVPKDLTKFIL